jgi:hypothetical protein
MIFFAKPFFRGKQRRKRFDFAGKTLLNGVLDVGKTPRRGNEIARFTTAKPLLKRFSLIH